MTVIGCQQKRWIDREEEAEEDKESHSEESRQSRLSETIKRDTLWNQKKTNKKKTPKQAHFEIRPPLSAVVDVKLLRLSRPAIIYLRVMTELDHQMTALVKLPWVNGPGWRLQRKLDPQVFHLWITASV